MNGSMYVFSRDFVGDGSGPFPDGHLFRQAIAIYALDMASARRVLSDQLRTIRADAGQVEPPFRRSPAWRVYEVQLDTPKVITSIVT